MKFPAITHMLTGVAVPVASLRSRLSTGVGEFADLVLFATWCRRTGLDLIQILPVNDTGTDASPYNARSAHALNPIYIRLQEIPGSERYVNDIAAARNAFEPYERLQYTDVLRVKIQILRQIFESTRSEIIGDPVFSEWMCRNTWLKPYTEFIGERDNVFPAWVQYLLERQLRDVALKLDAMGIALKGDIPILLSPDSADVRFNAAFFDTKFRVGAPPDMYSTEGQNWKFPSFRWSEMERDGFGWWRERLQRAANFYHAYRIDHVLGFFRVLLIPEAEDSAAFGFYEPALRIGAEQLYEDAGLTQEDIESLIAGRTLINTESGFAPTWNWKHSASYWALGDVKRSRLQALIEEYWNCQEPLWRRHGAKLLSAIVKSTDMLVCGEDLGVIPRCVPEVLDELNILGLRVERWTDEDGRLISPESFPRLTVATTSTHDSSTLRGWWEESGWNRQEYFSGLQLGSECPDYLTTEVCAAILKRILNSNSLIVVLPVQDLFALHYDLRTLDPSAERINVPGTASHMNWTYRMKVPIESLLSYDIYNDQLQAILARRKGEMVMSARSGH